MQAPRLGSVVSSVPSASSLTSLPRPSSANGHNSSTRLVSEASSILGSNESNGRNARVGVYLRLAYYNPVEVLSQCCEYGPLIPMTLQYLPASETPLYTEFPPRMSA